jgi:hypothetical protein
MKDKLPGLQHFLSISSANNLCRIAINWRENMPWFIIESERKTWTKCLVEAEDEEAALGASDRWQYLGYVDGDDSESRVVGGPFESEAKAMDDIASFVDG